MESGCKASGVVTGASAVHVEVEFDPPARCAGCTGACGWFRLATKQRLSFPTNERWPLGARVTITIPGTFLSAGAVVVYGVPLGGLLAGASVAWGATTSDLGAAVGALLGCFLAVLITTPLRARLERAALERYGLSRAPLLHNE